MDEKIDFVMIWVDGNDSEWQKERANYTADKGTDSSIIRYRDWENLKYWFRGVEKYAPWVNNIYFITNGQLPNWLNINNPKIKHVKHCDYMKKEYLPTFNANPIELNLANIDSLSEKFVYFNDDMFILNSLKKSDFFKKGLPCDTAVVTPFVTMENSVSNHMVLNDYECINKNFSFHKVLKKNISKWINLKYGTKNLRTIMMLPYKKFPGLAFQHMPSSFLKSSFKEVWRKEYELLNDTSMNKFRSKNDVNQWLIKWWQICDGKFSPRKYNIGINTVISDSNYQDVYKMISKQKFKLICINDDENINDFEFIKEGLNATLEKIFPNKSSFEK